MILQRLVRGLCVVWCLVWCVIASVGAAAAQTITVGSKNFGESYLLAEIAAQVLEAQGFRVNRKLGLGGTHTLGVTGGPRRIVDRDCIPLRLG